MSEVKWRLQVDQWIGTYGKIPTPQVTEVNALYTRKCFKCKTTKGKFHRHHKGSEYILAILRPDLWARIYVSFRREDWEYLCERCHKNVERSYEKLKDELFRIWNSQWHKLLPEQKWSFINIQLQQEFLEIFRAKFISRFQSWAKRKNHRRTAKRRKRVKSGLQ